MNIKPKGIIIAYAVPNFLSKGVYLLWLNPTDWNADWKPCIKCNDKNIKETTYIITLTIS